MRRRNLSALLLTAVVAALGSPTQAVAQQPVLIPSESRLAENELAELFSQGEVFEQEGRWGEALSHYDTALRENPGSPKIEARRMVARSHFDLSRRYADGRYLRTLEATTTEKALSQYGEILQKLDTHYVTALSWSALVDRGTSHFAVALSDETFRNAYHLPADVRRHEAVLAEVQRSIHARPLNNRRDAQQAVSVAARIIEAQLPLSAAMVISEYTCASAGMLDHYSTYLTDGQLDDIYAQIEGNFVGLGIELKTETDHLLVVHVIPGSPAEKAGMIDGDRIMAVEGKTVTEVSSEVAADMLKGEENSIATLVIRSEESADRELQVRRQRVEVPSIVDVDIIDEDLGIGYLKITSFQKTTTRDLDTALWDLHRAGMRSLVVDVRGNPGGLLTASVEIADRFIEEGTIVSTRGRAAREDFDYRAHVAGTWRVPLVVLIDGNSASASEIFAGAIHDHRRGTVVGERSYGKGSVQGIFPLAGSGAGVRLTTAKFYSPSGRAISNQGVNPDVLVRTSARPVQGEWVAAGEEPPVATLPRDAILDAALQVARDHLTQRP